MMKKTAFRTIFVAIGLIASGCGVQTPAPTFTPSVPSATPAPTETATPLPTSIIVPSPTATLPSPTRTASRIPTSTRTRLPSTVTPTRKSLAPVFWDSRLDGLGVKLVPAPVKGERTYWRLIRAEYWDEKQNQGKHHIYVNVLDEQGARIIGQEILVEWPGDKLVIVTENKPAPEYSANFPLDISHYPPFSTLGAFTVSVNGLPSDRVTGMGLPPRNVFVVYWLTFQRTAG